MSVATRLFANHGQVRARVAVDVERPNDAACLRGSRAAPADKIMPAATSTFVR